MRTIVRWSVTFAIGALIAVTALSQDNTSSTPSGASGPSPTPLVDPNILGSLGIWQATIRDWHSTDWQITQIVTNSATGQPEPQVARRFTEVGGGINYISDVTGAWERSTDNVDLMTNSPGAAAVHGPTKVFFSPTLGMNGPTISMVSCSNVVLQIQPSAIYYVDGSGNSALLA